MSRTGTLDHNRSRVTLHSHAELHVQAADARGQVSKERFKPGVEELRAALGVGEEERLECWLLLDRSGSVLFDRDEVQEVDLAWHFASFDSERDWIGILGFCGYGDYVNLFEFKAPLKEADRAMLLIASSGGGGTPTAEAVSHAAGMLRSSLKPESRHEHPGANNSAFMAEQFGSDWFEVESFTQTLRALLEHLAAMPGSGPREARVAHPGSERRVPAGHERLISAAAEAFLALGDEAAYQLSERALDASDPQLRAVAHYLRLRREQLHTNGDELLIAALKAAGLR